MGPVRSVDTKMCEALARARPSGTRPGLHPASGSSAGEGVAGRTPGPPYRHGWGCDKDKLL
eukprot:612955-Pyramimonas_sp.AAC.1